MLFQFAADYLKHCFRATSRHGTHSPFVYHLVDKVIYDFSAKKVYVSLEVQRKKRLNDGTGSEKLSGRSRTNQLLYRLAAWHNPQNILTLGNGLAMTNAYLLEAQPDSALHTMPAGDVQVHLPALLASENTIDIIVVQGMYTREMVLHCFQCCLPHVHEGSLFVLEGIYHNKAMKEAWLEIKNHPQVTVTIDLFRLGLVYFRKGQVREHFRIRF